MAATPKHAARVLGLSDDATLEDVRRVRRKMALKYHPDRSQDQERATRHMARINAAADRLTAHLKRQAAPKPNASRADFSAQPRTSQSSSHAETDSRQSASSTAKPDTGRETGTQVSPTTEYSAQESSDLALIRFASTSYRKVLDRISRIDTGPRVDATALAFVSKP